MFDSIFDTVPSTSMSDELQHYLAADVEDVKDRLKWWHERRRIFPELSRMARDYLSIPGEYLVFLHLSYLLRLLSRSHIC